ncbi:MAG: outer membrane lipoprotein-sorting protein [Gammaproteobacteria bacterium]|nr:outer membrane lipoprotein-sorting protein [Gammaproteobacteria bacterium]MYC24616.1 outer membrane lipoprotein-sorting protein [Gammaproteobacteria bacterium]
MKKFASSLAIVSLLGLVFPPLVHAETEEEAVAKGLEIAQTAQDVKKGFGNYIAKQIMVLKDRKGRESKRELRVQILEVEEQGDRILFLFEEPRDVRGTALLIHSNEDQPDDQWFFLPATNRVTRLNSAGQSKSFMGSEFSYEDMNPPEISKFTYKYLRDETCEDLNCTVSERVPVSKGSNYSRQLVWHDDEAYRVWKIEYYDRRGDHLKTLTVSDYEQYLDEYWFAQTMVMTNHVNGKSTTLNWSEFEFRVDLDEDDFTQTSLRRTR